MKRFLSVVLGITLSLCFVGTVTAETANTFAVGAIVTLGRYEQDNNLENGKEPVEWIVLDIKGNQALLISRLCLDARAYHTRFVPMTWSRCTLRAWLNDTFLTETFTQEEQAKIPAVTLANADNPHYGTPGGADTTDRIFLLSEAEAYQYFPDVAGRPGQPTEYAIAQGAYFNPSSGNTWWWLRSPGVRPIDASGVRSDGRISGYGSRDVYRPSGALRPALWYMFGE